MGYRRCQLDVSHALTPHLGLNDFHPAFFTHHAPVFHAFVLAAVTFVILGGSENLGAEQSVPLRFERPVINGFRFFDLPMGPLSNLVGRGKADLNTLINLGIFWFCEEIVYIIQCFLLICCLL